MSRKKMLSQAALSHVWHILVPELTEGKEGPAD